MVELLVAFGGRRFTLIVYGLTFGSAVSPLFSRELGLVGQRIIRSVGAANCSKGKESQKEFLHGELPKNNDYNPVLQLTSNRRNYAMSLNWFGGDGRRCPEGSGADILSIECLLYIDSIRA